MQPLDALKGSRIFVTGATGFIGSYLCRRLQSIGANLFVLARPDREGGAPRGRPALPKEAARIEADIRDEKALKAALASADPSIVFHMAAHTRVDRDPDLEDLSREVVLGGTKNLLEAMEGGKIQRLIHLGTCEEYGDGEAPFREEDPPRPVSPYSRAKVEATRMLMDLYRDERLPVVILRPFLTYGIGQAPERFVAQAVDYALTGRSLPMTPGEQTREFNHIHDMVEGILKAAVVDGIEGEIINLACGEEQRLKDMARMIYAMAQSQAEPALGAIPYRPGEAMRFFGSTEKCRCMLGYEPAVPLAKGLNELIRWERARREEERNGDRS